MGSDHVGMLVHGMFNASVPRPHKKKSSGAAVEIALEERLEFEVTAIHEARGLLALDGLLC